MRDIIITAGCVAAAYTDTANGCSAEANRPPPSRHDEFSLRHASHAGGKATDAGTPLGHGVGRLIEHHCGTGLGNADISGSPPIGGHHPLKKHQMAAGIDDGDAHRTAPFYGALLAGFKDSSRNMYS